MCILFIYADPNPKPGSYRTIIASNRDEFYKRPAKIAYKCDKTGVIGGRDLENGRQEGMWLGISTKQSSDYKFRFGALLNVAGEDKKPGGKPRGNIVTNFLSEQNNASQYSTHLHNISGSFNPFNFVAVELSNDNVNIHHISNAPTDQQRYEGKTILGFGNSPFNTPLQKVIKGRERFNSIISSHNEAIHKGKLINELIELLKWDERHLPDPELDKRLPTAHDPVSAVYVKFIEAGYGTRTHSIVLVDYDWNVEFIEDTMTDPIEPHKPTWNLVHILSNL